MYRGRSPHTTLAPRNALHAQEHGIIFEHTQGTAVAYYNGSRLSSLFYPSHVADLAWGLARDAQHKNTFKSLAKLLKTLLKV